VPVEDAAKLGSIFLFGERHGTKEAPAFVANFACYIAQRTREPVIVLLELPIPKVLSDLSADPISIKRAQNLIVEDEAGYWMEGHDGRTSTAMMDAIVDILSLRERGLDIALGSSYPGNENLFEYFGKDFTFSDEHMFKNRYIQEALQILKVKENYKNVIVLNGNVHTTNHIQFYKKMNVETSYIGFIQAYGGGSEWNCQRHAGGCKVHDTIPYRKHLAGLSDDASMVLLNGESELYDGAFVFKTTTASYPYIEQTSNK